MLVDTDVLIWYLKGNSKAYKTIHDLSSFSVSSITYMELVKGIRNKNELKEIRKMFNYWNVKVLSLTEEISTRAMFYIENFSLSHSIDISDALIAATAVNCAIPILTGNYKHFSMIKELDLIRFKS